MSKVKEFYMDKLDIKVFDDRKTMGEAAASEAASRIVSLLAAKDEVNVIFASAPSQSEFLAALLQHGEIDWSRVNAFHLDEYIGLDKDAPQGFGNFLKDRLFGRLSLKSVNYLDGNAPDIEVECARYAELLKKHPADIICMGIGENGHLAFNDPHVADFRDSRLVKAVELDLKCRMQQVNDGCFDSIDKVPTHALTLTIPSLTAGKYIYCMVPGKTKMEAVYRTIFGSVTEQCPASILRTHGNAMLYTDRLSADKVLKTA